MVLKVIDGLMHVKEKQRKLRMNLLCILSYLLFSTAALSRSSANFHFRQLGSSITFFPRSPPIALAALMCYLVPSMLAFGVSYGSFTFHCFSLSLSLSVLYMALRLTYLIQIFSRQTGDLLPNPFHPVLD